MDSDHVHVERDGPVAILRLDRPPVNALTLEYAVTIHEAFNQAIASDPAALVVTGTGKAFSAGLDLKAVPFYTPDQQKTFLRTINPMIAALYTCPLPVIGAINGHAIAGGCILAICTDHRVGTADPAAKFGLTEARAGIPFPAGPMIVLRHEIAPQHVRFMTLDATNFGPEEALRRGVLDEIQPPDQVLARAVELAKDRAAMPAGAYGKIKRQVRAAAIEQLTHVVEQEDDPMLQDWVSAEASTASSGLLKSR